MTVLIPGSRAPVPPTGAPAVPDRPPLYARLHIDLRRVAGALCRS
ncbi:putative leader peptide [Streptomyces sp. NPDC000594]